MSRCHGPKVGRPLATAIALMGRATIRKVAMVLKAIHGKITFVITLLFIASSAPVLAAGLKTEFVYDAVGNLRHLSAPNGETSYDYDVLDRVTGESGPAATTTYTYDANGNRLTGLGATLTYPPLSAPSSRVSTRQVGATTYSYAYDSTTFGSTGNVVNDGTFQYVYTSRGQIKQVKQGATVIATYTYDYQNRRTRKVVGSTTTMYHYNQEGLLIAETSSTNVAQKTYAYRGGVPVGQIDHGSPVKVTYLFSDNLGTPRSGRDVSKNIVWTWYSDAFGSSTANADPDGNSILTNVNLRLPGQYFDAESGLHYNWNRLYDAKIGRYLQSDPIGLDGGINTYAYVSNNPSRFTDPLGLVQMCHRDLQAPIPHARHCYARFTDGSTSSYDSGRSGARSGTK